MNRDRESSDESTTTLGQLLAALADQPRSQFAQNQRNVMLDAVTFVSSFTDPGASQCWHFGGIVSVSGFVARGIGVNAFAMRPR
jgi:hypothetical protein